MERKSRRRRRITHQVIIVRMFVGPLLRLLGSAAAQTGFCGVESRCSRGIRVSVWCRPGGKDRVRRVDGREEGTADPSSHRSRQLKQSARFHAGLASANISDSLIRTIFRPNSSCLMLLIISLAVGQSPCTSSPTGKSERALRSRQMQMPCQRMQMRDREIVFDES